MADGRQDTTAQRWAPTRRGLRLISFLPLVGVRLQTVLGGITVLTGLSRALVAAYFLASMVLVSLSAYLLYRVSEGYELSGLSLAFCGRR